MSSIIRTTGMDNTSGQFKIAAVGDFAATPGGIIGVGSTPTLTIASGAGTGATATIAGSNLSGKIVLTSGTLSLASGLVLTLTFADSLTYPNGCFITFSAGDSNFASVYTNLYANTSTTTVTLFTRVALTLGTSYTGYYKITGY